MADQILMIYSRQGSASGRLLLGVHQEAPNAVVQCSPDASQGAQVWSTQNVLGTPYIFLKHESSGLFARFATQSGGQITLAALDPQDPTFAIQLQPTGGGYVAINNVDASMVMDVQGASTADNTPVIAYVWNGDNNQQWLVGPPTS